MDEMNRVVARAFDCKAFSRACIYALGNLSGQKVSEKEFYDSVSESVRKSINEDVGSASLFYRDIMMYLKNEGIISNGGSSGQVAVEVREVKESELKKIADNFINSLPRRA